MDKKPSEVEEIRRIVVNVPTIKAGHEKHLAGACCEWEKLTVDQQVEAILSWHTKHLAKEKMELVDQINSKHFICKQCGCVEKMNVNLEALKSEIQEKKEEG